MTRLPGLVGALVVLMTAVWATPATARYSLPVFPGAEGFGTRTAAGRGGSVCRVTSLDDTGPGTLRTCLEGRWPRTVVFEVGGTVRLRSPLRIEDPYVSVYGQTAPGDGIQLVGAPHYEEAVLGIATHDVLLQHLRVRAGASRAPSCCRDAVSIASKRPGRVYNVVLDHLSVSWGTDEVMDIWYDAHDITVSRSIIAEGLNDSTNDKGPAGRGFIVGGEESHSISVHHNLFAHNYQRNPMVASPGVTDVVNNLVYHWVSRGMEVHERGESTTRVNLVANLFVPGRQDGPQRTRDEWSDIAVKAPTDRVAIHLEGNVRERRDGSIDRPLPPQASLIGAGLDEGYDPDRGWLVAERHPAPEVRTVPAEALRDELRDDVGATRPRRDATDARIVDELRTGTGRMIDCVAPDDPPSRAVCEASNAGGWPAFAAAVAATGRADTDRDGIPDAWERDNGLDPDRASDGNERAPSGYTWLETWVHSLD